MKCKRIKELLLADYMDNEIEEASQLALDAHIKICSACRQLKESIDTGLLPLLENAKVQSPQEEMWQGIKTRIISGTAIQEDKVFVLTPIIRRSIFAFATAAVLLFMVLTFHNAGNSQRSAVGRFLSEEAGFLYSLNINESQYAFNSIDFGTAIEEWFL